MGSCLVGRRYSAARPHKERNRTKGSRARQIAHSTWCSGEPREKHGPSQPNFRLCWSDHRPQEQHDQNDRGKATSSHTSHTKTDQEQQNNSQTSGGIGGDAHGLLQSEPGILGPASTHHEVCCQGSSHQCPNFEYHQEVPHLEAQPQQRRMQPPGDQSQTDTPGGTEEPNTPNTTGIQGRKRHKSNSPNRCLREGLGSFAPDWWCRGSHKRAKVDKRVARNAHLPSGGPCERASNSEPVAENTCKMPIDTANGRSSHSVGLDKGKQKHCHEQHCQTNDQEAPFPWDHADQSAYSGTNEPQGRLSQPESGCKKLCAETASFPSHLSKIQGMAHTRFICKQVEQADGQFLQLEDGQESQRQCMGGALGERNLMVKSPLGAHPQGPGQTFTGQGASPSMSPIVGDGTMVAKTSDNDTTNKGRLGNPNVSDNRPRGKHFSRPRGQNPSPTSLGNTLHSASRLTMGELMTALRNMECEHDIPVRARMQWVKDALWGEKNPRRRLMLQQCCKRLDRGTRTPRYPTFFSIEPLVKAAFSWSSNILQVDRLILQLRLTTMMRSGDLENVSWALFHWETVHYIRTTNKQGKPSVYNVTGHTLTNLIDYMYKHRKNPAPFLIRYIKEPGCCMGGERIAKRLLHLMASLGVNTEVFKAHSLRGATATHLLRLGVPQTMVQARGAWSDNRTLDLYYSRLHQDKDWQELLQGENVSTWHSLTCAAPFPTSSTASSTQEEESGEGEGKGTAQVNALAALGVLRPLFQRNECPSCGLLMEHEALYRCQQCQLLYHVRCMGPEQGANQRQTQYSTKCFICNMAGQYKRKGYRGSEAGAQGKPIIEDPMGVFEGPQ